jgi:nitroreductase
MNSKAAGTAAAVFRSIAQGRKSTNRFHPDRTIPPAVVKDILQSTIRSPSSFNIQPTQILLVQDAAVKQELREQVMIGASNQYRVQDCSVLAVFLTDLQPTHRIQHVHQLEKQWSMKQAVSNGGRHPMYLATMPLTTSFLIGQGSLATTVKQTATQILSQFGSEPMPTIDPVESWGYKNSALAVQSYVLAATSHGLGTAIMEGYDSARMRKVLRIPDRYNIPMVVATGYDYNSTDERELTPRMRLDELVFQDRFGVPYNEAEKDDEGVLEEQTA